MKRKSKSNEKACFKTQKTRPHEKQENKINELQYSDIADYFK